MPRCTRRQPPARRPQRTRTPPPTSRPLQQPRPPQPTPSPSTKRVINVSPSPPHQCSGRRSRASFAFSICRPLIFRVPILPASARVGAFEVPLCFVFLHFRLPALIHPACPAPTCLRPHFLCSECLRFSRARPRASPRSRVPHHANFLFVRVPR